MNDEPCLCGALRKATRAVTRLYDDALRTVDLRIMQFAVLRNLARLGAQRMRDLAELMVLEETTLTRSVAILDERGLVAVKPGADRRERVVSITAAGRATLAAALPLWETAQARMRDGLAEDWSAFVAQLIGVTESAAP